MTAGYDVLVVGSGPGGYIAALKAAQLGARVGVVEQEKVLGGTCLNNGCIPSKALLASAELLDRIGHAGTWGVSVDGSVGFDWSAIQKRKDKVIQTLRGGIAALFKSRKVTVHHGRGVLDGPNKVVVSDGSKREVLTGEKVILAVGSVPSRIPGWPTDPQVVCTSDEALHWTSLPKHLLIVGGGVIGCEFACMMRAFGVDVTIVEMMPRILPEWDADLSAALAKVFKRRAIQCFVDTKVSDLTIGASGVTAKLDSGETIAADRVLVATGRRANTAELGLDTVGLTTDRGFVRVDERMETQVKGIYCIGDANGRSLLAHAASGQGIVAVANALGGRREDDAVVSNCVYTFPELACVGLTADRAQAEKLPIAIGMFPMGHLGKAMAVGETDGFVKVIRHRESDELLGVHMVGHNVTEVIAAASVLVHQKAKCEDVASMIFAHPTISESVRESTDDSLSQALHLPPRKVIRLVAG